MLRSTKDFEQYEIGATDGPIGHVSDLYFADDAWVIRYLVVETGTWLSDRKVLISPISIHRPDWASRTLPVAITRDQVKDSPDIDTDKPVSRQHEMQYLGYYGYPYYWDGASVWGAGLYPYTMIPGHAGDGLDAGARERQEVDHEKAERAIHANDDPHLRSCEAVVGYHLHATDGDIGHVVDFLMDEDTWFIRYLVVETSHWWSGHKVLIAPEWITEIDWDGESVAVHLTRDAVKQSPLYDPNVELSRRNEADLYAHHGRAGYWEDSDVLASEY